MSMRDTILLGDALQLLTTLPGNSVDAIVTDPPAGIAFMGKDWDRDKGGRNAWIAWLAEVMTECRRVLKPGGHALVWALPRTSHWTGMALEDAGFEVRDKLAHWFGSGFPKSLDVSKQIDKAAGAEREVIGRTAKPRKGKAGHAAAITTAALDNYEREDVILPITAPATDAARQWDGWGTALKPAYEDWWLVRKPLEDTVAANVLAHGTGALNIAACRVGTDDQLGRSSGIGSHIGTFQRLKRADTSAAPSAGRWPPHLLLSHSVWCTADTCDASCPVAALDAQSGVRTSGKMKAGTRRSTDGGYMGHMPAIISQDTYGDSGGASRYFPQFRYVPKASRRERNAGCESIELRQLDTGRQADAPGANNPRNRGGETQHNSHPTVKPQALMCWLVRLITPPGGLVLDPFAGSGSTLVAAVAEGAHFLGIEREAEYVQIAQARVAEALQHAAPVSHATQPQRARPVRRLAIVTADMQQTLWSIAS